MFSEFIAHLPDPEQIILFEKVGEGELLFIF
jgi:hypothetical protein